ncbi:MAG: ribonuclease HII [Rhizobiaceae bacterium]|nr:ribonuclease HII [Rhizobiaceae bacterium]
MPRARADSPQLFAPAAGPDFSVEARLLAQGTGLVAGVDEAGRGPLAGPVVAAAVILDPCNIPCGLDDSKVLPALRRETLFDAILVTSLAVSVASSNAETIDRTNILAATMVAMRRAVVALSVPPGHVLVDGNRLPDHLPCTASAMVKGDGRSVSIAAASIIAKVMRDRMMIRADAALPEFGFLDHKGYGAERHRAALAHHGGVHRLHRFSFAPLRKA